MPRITYYGLEELPKKLLDQKLENFDLDVLAKQPKQKEEEADIKKEQAQVE